MNVLPEGMCGWSDRKRRIMFLVCLWGEASNEEVNRTSREYPGAVVGVWLGVGGGTCLVLSEDEMERKRLYS